MIELNTLQSEFEQVYKQVDKITKDFQETKTNYENLNNHTKTVLAQIATRFTGSESERTRLALADSDYVTHLEALKFARQQYNRASALLEGLRLKISILQSLNRHLAVFDKN